MPVPVVTGAGAPRAREADLIGTGRIIAAAVALAVATAAPAAARGARADSLEVTATVQPSGDVTVVERLLLNAGRRPQTRLVRVIPAEGTDGIADVSAALDGAVLARGTSPGRVRIEGARPLRVEWLLPRAAAAEAHEFVLRYRLLRAVRQGERADTLRWSPLPSQRDYSIGEARVRLEHPGMDRVTMRLERGAARIQPMPDAIVLTSAELRRGQTLRVMLALEPGSTTEMGVWQRRRLRTQRVIPVIVALAALALVLGIWLPSRIVERHRRSQPIGPVRQQTSPPGRLAPALAGALVGGAGTPSADHALATALDLAARSVLVVHPPEHAGRAPSVVVGDADPASLAGHERALLEALFPGGRRAVAAVGVRMAFLARQRPFAAAVRRELESGGLLDPRRVRARRTMVTLGWAMVGLAAVAAGAVLVALLHALGAWPLLVPFAIALAGLAALAGSARIAPLTDRGEEEAARWDAFAGHLDRVARGTAGIDGERARAWLPYAVAFGLGAAWAAVLERTGGLPEWLRPGGEGTQDLLTVVGGSATG